MLGKTIEDLIVHHPSLGNVIRKALPLRPGGRPLPSVESLTPSKQDNPNSLALPILYSLTAYPEDFRVGAVGITTTRDKLAKLFCVPDPFIIYVGKVIQSTATKWYRQQNNLPDTTPVSKETALRYARSENPPPDFDLLIDEACTRRVVKAVEAKLGLPIILDTKLLWLLLLMGKDCPIAMAKSLPSNLAQITIGFTCDTNIANARHVRRQKEKPPKYQPTAEELHNADEERAQRYQGDQKAFKAQYGVSYTPQVIFNGLNLVVDTTHLTPEQQVKKITKYVMRKYRSNPTALRTLNLIPRE